MDEDTIYYVQVRAVNEVGASAPSLIQSERTFDLDERPVAPVLTASATYTVTQMTVTLTASVADNGGQPITQWQYRTGGTTLALSQAAWQTISGASGDSLSHELANLTRQDHYYQVRAMNSVGHSPVSNTSLVPGVIPPAKPTLSAATDATDGHHQINLTAATTDNGGAAIQDWQYKAATSSAGLAAASWVSTSESGSSLTAFAVENLALATTYYFQARCYNGEEYSPASDTASAATTAAEKPDKPTFTAGNLMASSIDATASTVSDNGAPITSWQYRYATTSGGVSTASWRTAEGATGLSPTFTMTGFSAQTTYYIQVRSRNSVGFSDPSSTVSATTPISGSAPPAPTGLRISAETGGRNRVNNGAFLRAAVCANDGGNPILRWEYQVIFAPGNTTPAESAWDGASWLTAPDNGYLLNLTSSRGALRSNTRPYELPPAIINGLTRASGHYYFRVRAVNAVGGSPPSNAAAWFGNRVPQSPVSGPFFGTYDSSGQNVTLRNLGGAMELNGAITSWEYGVINSRGNFVRTGTFSGASGPGVTVTIPTPSNLSSLLTRARNSAGVSGADGVRSLGTLPAGGPTAPSFTAQDRGSYADTTAQILLLNVAPNGSSIHDAQYRVATSSAGVAEAPWVRFRTPTVTGSHAVDISLYPGISLNTTPYFMQVRLRNHIGWTTSTVFRIGNMTLPLGDDPEGAGGLSEEGASAQQSTTAPSFRLTEGDGTITIDWAEPAAQKPQPWPFGQVEGYDQSWSADDSTFYETRFMDLGSTRVVNASIGYPEGLYAPDGSGEFGSESEVELTLLHGTAQNNLTAVVVNRNAQTEVTARYLKARIHLKKTANRALPNVTLAVEEIS